MQVRSAILATALSFSLMAMPLCAAPAEVLGTVVTADRAHVGAAKAEVGTTIYVGDSLSTEPQGSVQLRAGKARLLLLSSSTAVVSDASGTPSAKLLAGSAKFSTGNAQAFTLFAAAAAIRAQSDAPTIGQVSYLGPKELLVSATRGTLVVTVDSDTQIIPEGSAYRVILDVPEEMAQGPEGAGSGKEQWPGGQKQPRRAGRSRFMYFAAGGTAVVTTIAVIEALESDPRP